MSWYKEYKEEWTEIIETVAAEEHRQAQMIGSFVGKFCEKRGVKLPIPFEEGAGVGLYSSGLSV